MMNDDRKKFDRFISEAKTDKTTLEIERIDAEAVFIKERKWENYILALRDLLEALKNGLVFLSGPATEFFLLTRSTLNERERELLLIKEPSAENPLPGDLRLDIKIVRPDLKMAEGVLRKINEALDSAEKKYGFSSKQTMTGKNEQTVVFTEKDPGPSLTVSIALKMGI